MKIGIVSKLGIEERMDHVREIIHFLKERGEDLMVEASLAEALKIEGGTAIKDMKPEIMVTVGGDGTILWALEGSDAPIFGINAGFVGFLTEVPIEESIAGLKRVLDNDYLIEERTKLATEHNGERLYDAMNEAVIHTAQIAKMQHFEIYVDDMLMERLRGDGLIISTPTGSTSYSMSVGGPIVDPRVNATIIVPIAAFKLSARPHIVPMESRVQVNVLNPKPAIIVLDGQYQREVRMNDVLTFRISEVKAKFIRFKQSFYERINKQLIL